MGYKRKPFLFFKRDVKTSIGLRVAEPGIWNSNRLKDHDGSYLKNGTGVAVRHRRVNSEEINWFNMKNSLGISDQERQWP